MRYPCPSQLVSLQTFSHLNDNDKSHVSCCSYHCVCCAAFLGVAKSTMGNSIANGDVCRDYLWRYAAKHKPSTASGGGAAGPAREDKTVGRVNNAQEPGLREGAATFSSERSALKAPEAPVMQVMQSCSDLTCRGLSLIGFSAFLNGSDRYLLLSSGRRERGSRFRPCS